jgi:hypothetical protein
VRSSETDVDLAANASLLDFSPCILGWPCSGLLHLVEPSYPCGRPNAAQPPPSTTVANSAMRSFSHCVCTPPSILARARVLQTGTGAAVGQRVPLQVAPRVDPYGLPIVPIIRYAIPVVGVGVDGARFGPWWGRRARVALVGTEYGIRGAAVGYERLVMVRAVAVAFQEIVVPAARYGRKHRPLPGAHFWCARARRTIARSTPGRVPRTWDANAP